jgi:hypothetical protein
MRKLQPAAGLAAMALMAGSALAQTSPAPTQRPGSGRWLVALWKYVIHGVVIEGVALKAV